MGMLPAEIIKEQDAKIGRLQEDNRRLHDQIVYWRARDEEGRKIEEELRAELAAERERCGNILDGKLK